jgi:hypothetical protein
MSGSHISLFAGIGMIDRAAEALGFETIATAEIIPFCWRVLQARFPSAVHITDVKHVSNVSPLSTLHPSHFKALKRPLLVSGGFPCQDVSDTGTKLGTSGTRWLWAEFARVIGEFEPEYVLVENVAALRRRGLDTILNDLHYLGYDAWWDCIPAGAVGAPHMRDRIWIQAKRIDQQRLGGDAGDPFGIVWYEGAGIAGMKGLPGRPNALPAITELPRAGRMIEGRVYEEPPRATVSSVRKGFRLASPAIYNGPGWPGIAPFGQGPLGVGGFNLNKPWFYPTPTRSDGSGGPGTTPKRTGGKNLRTVVAELDGNGRLNPQWLEWMMGVPGGWSDPALTNADLLEHDGWEREPRSVARVANVSLPNRPSRVQALGNGAVPQVAAYVLSELLGRSQA